MISFEEYLEYLKDHPNVSFEEDIDLNELKKYQKEHKKAVERVEKKLKEVKGLLYFDEYL